MTANLENEETSAQELEVTEPAAPAVPTEEAVKEPVPIEEDAKEPVPAEEDAKEPVRSLAMDWAIAFTERQPLGHSAIEGKVMTGSELYSLLRGTFGDRLVDHGVIHYTAREYLLPTEEQWEQLLDETLDLDPRLQGESWLRRDLAWPLRFKILRRASGSAATDPDVGLVPPACGVLVDLPVGGGQACLNVLLSHDDGETKVWIVDPANGRRRPVDGSDRGITIIYI